MSYIDLRENLKSIIYFSHSQVNLLDEYILESISNKPCMD